MIKILLVEDETEKQENIINTLKKMGIYGPSITTVDNVRSAQSKLTNCKYDVLILDLNLPLRPGKIEQPKEDAGTSILYKLSSPQYITPTYVIGLTGFPELKEVQSEKFNKFDFNIYSYNDDNWKDILLQKINWLKQNQAVKSDRASQDEVFILVHGVMTIGDWQERLQLELKKDNRKIYPYEFNFYSAIKISNGISRRRKVKDFTAFFEQTLIENPNSKINIIAHSFGTYLTVKALEKCKLDNLSEVSNILLTGSVLRNDYNFTPIINKYSIKNIINDCGYNDIPLIFNKLFSFGLGNAGRVGFNTCNNKLENRFHKCGHSVLDSSESFTKQYIHPIFDCNEIQKVDERKFGSFRQFIESFLNMLNPYIGYTIIFVVIYKLTV